MRAIYARNLAGILRNTPGILLCPIRTSPCDERERERAIYLTTSWTGLAHRRGLNTHMLRTHGEVLEKHSRARTAPTAAAQTVASMTAFPVALGVPHPQEPPPTTHTSLALLSAEATVFGHSEFVKVEPEYDTTVKAEPLSADDGQCTDVDSASACTPESKT